VTLTSAELTAASLMQRLLDLEQALAGLQARFNTLEDIVNIHLYRREKSLLQ
jgi:hypothetical protein